MVSFPGTAAELQPTSSAVHVGKVVEGALLATNAGGSLGDSFGSLCQNFSLMSGVQVAYERCNVQPSGGGLLFD